MYLPGCNEVQQLEPAGTGLKKGGNGNGQGGGGGQDNTTRYPLKIPQEVAPGSLVLSAAPSASDLGSGDFSRVWAYNNQFAAPTIRAHTGDHASIVLENHLNEATITHWHGMIVDHLNDGHPRLAIGHNDQYEYNFTINQRAAMNWYHPHPHGLTGKQVNLGLAGAFIIHDAEEAALSLPSGEHEVPLIIRDAKLDRNGNLIYKPRSGGFVGDVLLVNGTMDPYLEVDRAVYRFRILNGANARIFHLELDNGQAMTLIGNDGGLLESASEELTLVMSPGERLDVLIDLRNLGSDDRVILRDTESGWDLVEFRGKGGREHSWTELPSSLSYITPLGAPVRVRDFSFDGMSKINGQLYEMDRIDFHVPFGEVELWRFTTNGNAPHPVHVHGVPFQVISRSGGRGKVFPWERGWKDTVLLEDGETVEVLIVFDRFDGLYLMHCHKLEHEDMGMMSNFMVDPPVR